SFLNHCFLHLNSPSLPSTREEYNGLSIGRFDQKRKMTKKSSAFGFLFVFFLFISSKSFVKATFLNALPQSDL
ncbi:MAG TPA: hypothetical protein VKI62_03570, partial [Bacteroidota bacterium]|nr:hypothetical protein [Bacteroidota bacterium]